MIRTICKPRAKDARKEDVADQWLGERHTYDKDDQQDLSRIALRLGFSSSEISELERIYRNQEERVLP